MMFWIFVLVVVAFLSVLIYSLRFSSRYIKGFPIVQFCYLFFSTPITTLALINIALDIIARPSTQPHLIPDHILLSGYILAVVIGAIGMGAHAVSLTIEDALTTDRSEAYILARQIHGIISHQMIYLGSMFTAPIIFWLELNHPQNFIVDPIIPLSLGIVIGLLFSVMILRSTFFKINSIFTCICLGLTLPALFLIQNDFSYYPMAVLSITVLVTMLIIFSLSWLIFRHSQRVCKIMVRAIYPKGHDFRDQICG